MAKAMCVAADCKEEYAINEACMEIRYQPLWKNPFVAFGLTSNVSICMVGFELRYRGVGGKEELEALPTGKLLGVHSNIASRNRNWCVLKLPKCHPFHGEKVKFSFVSGM